MSKLKELLVKITGDGAELEKALNDAARNLDATGKKFERLGKDLSLKFTAPIVAVGAGILALTHRAADYADQIDKSTARTNLSREALQEYAFAADQSGVSVELLINSLQRLTRRSSDAAQGNESFAGAFRELGVAIKDADGQLRTTEDLLPDLADAFAKVEHQSDRVRLAFQLFDVEGAQLLPLLSQGAAGMDALRERARELGLVLSDQAIRDLVDFKDAWSEVQMQLGAIGREVAVGFLPIFRDQLIPFIQTGILPRIREWTAVLREIDVETVKVVATTAGLVAAIGPLLFVMGSTIRTASTLIQTLMLLGATKAALGAMLLPGGAILAGLSLFVGGLIRAQLQAAAAAVETAQLKAEIMGLTDAERALRLERAQARQADLALEISRAREELEKFKASAGAGVSFSGGMTGTTPAQKRIGELQAVVDGAIADMRQLSEELSLLGEAEQRAALGGERMKEILEEMAEASRQLAKEFAAQAGATGGAGSKTRTAADVMADLGKNLERAAELHRLLGDQVDLAAAEYGAYDAALRELLVVEGASEEQKLSVVAALQLLREEMAGAADDAKKLAEEQALVASLLAATVTAGERYAAAETAINAALERGKISQEEATRALAEAKRQLEESTEQLVVFGSTWEAEWASVVISSITNVRGSFRSMADDLIRQIARVTARLIAMRALMFILAPFAGGTGIGAALYAAAAAPFGGGKAGGGAVLPNRTYLVGERGPEVFVPSRVGTIVPNRALASSGGGTLRYDLASLPPRPSVVTPDAVATDDWWRRAFSHLIIDYDQRK